MSEKQSVTSLLCFFFLCLTPGSLAKCFNISQSLPCIDEEGTAPFQGTLGGPETPLSCPALRAPWEQPDWAEHRIRSRRCWLPVRCRANLRGMFPWQAASSWHQCQIVSTVIVAIYEFCHCLYESLLRQLGYLWTTYTAGSQTVGRG